MNTPSNSIDGQGGEGKTIGQLISEAMKLHELNPLIVEAKIKLSKGVLTRLMNDDFYTNSVPVVLFKNLMLSLHIPFEKVEQAMLPTFRLLISKETPETLREKPAHYQLWENEEAVLKYTNGLRELMKADTQKLESVEHWVALKGPDCYEIKAQPHPAMRGFTKLIAYVEDEKHAQLIARAPELLSQLTAAKEENERLKREQTSPIYDYHDGGKVNVHPQFIDGFNDGYKSAKAEADALRRENSELKAGDKLHSWMAIGDNISTAADTLIYLVTESNDNGESYEETKSTVEQYICTDMFKTI